jgi:hypothetical protein
MRLRAIVVILCAACAFVASADCLIISEVVHGSASGACPRWIEITNTGLTDYTFPAGGLIVQLDDETDLAVDVDLTGVTISAGQSFVIDSRQGGQCTGAFQFGVYEVPPDLSTMVLFSDGDGRYAITDTADGSHIIDVYGELGVDGTGTAWECTNGYAYRLPGINSGSGATFDVDEWYVADQALPGGDVEMHLALTTPFVHDYDEDCVAGPPCLARGDSNCDGLVNSFDIDPFVIALTQPATWQATYTCDFLCANDINCDGAVNSFDIDGFVQCLTVGCPPCP